MDSQQFFFKYRSFTPLPLVLVLLYQADPVVKWGVIGLVILLVGESIRIWAVRYAGGATRTRDVGANRLVTSGPFGYLRNPLYLGNMLIYTGIVLIAGGRWMWQLLVITLAFFFWQYSQIISLEEETLEGIFGKVYRYYKSKVPRIIPRIRPWRNTGAPDDHRLTLIQALRPERSTLVNIVFILLLIAGKWLLLHY